MYFQHPSTVCVREAKASHLYLHDRRCVGRHTTGKQSRAQPSAATASLCECTHKRPHVRHEELLRAGLYTLWVQAAGGTRWYAVRCFIAACAKYWTL